MSNDFRGDRLRLRQVDLNLLVTLRVLLEERSVTRAALRLGLGQPAVSGGLARLRDLLGDELLVRVGRTMRPTPRAEALLEQVRDILDRTEKVLWPAQAFDPASLRCEIRITLGDYEEITLLPQLARRLSADAPGVVVRAQSLSSDARAQLERSETDLWITPFDQRALELPYQIVLNDRWVAVGCRKAWPKDATLRRRDLPELELVVRSAPTGTFPRSSTFRRHLLGAPPAIALYNSYSASLPFLVAGTHRVALMPERLASKLAGPAGVRILPWPVELPAIRRVAQWHPRMDSDPVIRWVRDQLAVIAADPVGSSDRIRQPATTASTPG